ncbi:MAG: phosphohydrolase [Oscillospiraceae bacterium]|nr:phosphohydrolase [Oscillospiraceae bacterium]
MSDYITTFSNIKFTPATPRIEDIKIEDIAHSLAHMCRGNGHVKTFFSVAQHSINCAIEAKARGYGERLQLACLLHDGSEAYLGDITRPFKKSLPEYLKFEEVLQEKIYHKFLGDVALTPEENAAIYEIDNVMLYYEMIELMDYKVYDKAPDLVSEPQFGLRDFIQVEQEFLETFKKLTKN